MCSCRAPDDTMPCRALSFSFILIPPRPENVRHPFEPPIYKSGSQRAYIQNIVYKVGPVGPKSQGNFPASANRGRPRFFGPGLTYEERRDACRQLCRAELEPHVVVAIREATNGNIA